MKTKCGDLDTCELAASTPQKTHHYWVVFLVNSVDYQEQRKLIRFNHIKSVLLSNKADTEWFQHIYVFNNVNKTYLFDLKFFSQIVSEK